MSGIFLSIISGITFGLFGTVNRRASHGANVYQSTFILLFVSSIVLIIVAAVTEDRSLLFLVSPLAIFYFALAAFIHFFIGWTLFSFSQKTVGAARTGVLIGTVSLWGTIFGIIFFAEYLSIPIFFGIFLMIVGSYVVSSDPAKLANAEIKTGFKASLYGLGTAVCFAASSIFIRFGLELLSSPLVGVTIGMTLVTLLYGIIMGAQIIISGEKVNFVGSKLWLQILAGILVALATWWRWLALDLTPIAVVIALSRLSIPTVLILSPMIIGQKLEQVNLRVWIGGGVIVIGAMVLTFS